MQSTPPSVKRNRPVRFTDKELRIIVRCLRACGTDDWDECVPDLIENIEAHIKIRQVGRKVRKQEAAQNAE